MSTSDIVPWPAADAARYRAAGHWRDRALGHWMWHWAGRFGDRVALVDGDLRLTLPAAGRTRGRVRGVAPRGRPPRG
ncbi:hypothetical protein [Actinophytocola sp. NPDC049390]|uniref:hypothetical protein n=1 Tax=Actinophytocola sp. NPDC049390 TaxID=3363894 RepID=UPI0037B2BD13